MSEGIILKAGFLKERIFLKVTEFSLGERHIVFSPSSTALD